MTTGLIHDPRFQEHDTGPRHPERPERLAAIDKHLRDTGLINRLHLLPFDRADMSWVRRVHTRSYVERLELACGQGRMYIDVEDSAICPASLDIAQLAVGGALAAVDAVMKHDFDNAFCALRPPGHHAEMDRSMGFCLFNNIAIAAEYLIAHHKLERVAIVDFDVHHGNGTQHIFEPRRDVMFISLHQDPRFLFPGTGFAEEQGIGEGKGFTLNIPMPPFTGDEGYRKAFHNQVLPALNRFKPQFMLVSAGFDLLAADPLANMLVSPECVVWMTRELMAAADLHCMGKLVSLLEGGYELDALAECVGLHLRALLGDNGDIHTT
ncbi:MAG: histone deacetylase [Phycisphaeraceae bacterium]|nr:histone deacetylase [Phycisphaeraceae bacterium]